MTTDALQDWLRSEVAGYGDAVIDSTAPLADGYSSQVSLLRLRNAPVEKAVLKVQPERGIFEPYDVLREGDVLLTLSGTGVPAPRLLAKSADPAITGNPFILMECLPDEHIPLPAAVTGDGAWHSDLEHSFMRALAGVHALDWESLGFSWLGVPDSPAAAFVHEVDVIAGRMPAFGCADEPLLRRAAEILSQPTLTEGSLGLCHGDANIFNYLYSGSAITGIVDWEQARVSDPRYDLGQLGALGHLLGAPFGPADQMPYAALYESATGHRPADLEWFRALWLFQLGTICFGMRTYTGTDAWFTWPQVASLLEQSLANVDGGSLR